MLRVTPTALMLLLEVALPPGWNEGTSARSRANGIEVNALPGSATIIVI
ncbi:MAG: hypothetical protein AAF283_00810 [Cyanobacteria bacterium P01_A01_bin.70]